MSAYLFLQLKKTLLLKTGYCYMTGAQADIVMYDQFRIHLPFDFWLIRISREWIDGS